MIAKNVVGRTVVGAVGGIMLVGLGTAAMGAVEDSTDVDVNVEIEALEPEGALTMTVDGDSTALTENGSTDEYRQFTGVLPDVTVTDTREPAPEGVYWYVVGQASAFTGDAEQPDIDPGHLGWAPELLTDGDGEVAAGEEVPTVMDESTNPTTPNNVGLAGQEFLQLSLDSAEAQAANGSWTANADLTLKTEVDVAPGSYSSVLTLSLFEETY